MRIAQISVFMENKPGHLSQLIQILDDHGLRVLALSIADTSDFGILRMLVRDADRAYQVLADQGMTASLTKVICARLSKEKGSLASLLASLHQQDINVEYMYPFLAGDKDKPILALKVENIRDAEEKLGASGLDLLSQEDIASL